MKNKKLIRKEILERRKNLSEEYKDKCSNVIINKILQMKQYQNAKTIFCYISTFDEVNTRFLIEDAWMKHKKVAVPKIVNKTMKFYYITSYEQLSRGAFNILEPDMGCIQANVDSQCSVVIVPGVAYDSKKNRIGYGAGYYDKFFYNLSNICKIAPAFSIQIVNEIPNEEHDIKVDYLITENFDL